MEKIDLRSVSTYKSKAPEKSNTSNFDAVKAKNIFGKKIKENDLNLVEGIGPKIEEILNKDGITSWSQLGNAPTNRLQKILDNAGDRFSFHKPDTWPKQSNLVSKGEWSELKKLQDYLDGGKEPKK